jgi:predicted MFS family arabinose efflux permease
MPRQQPFPRSFFLLVAANFFFFASFQWTYATISNYIQEIGGDAAAIGLAYGLSSLSAVASRPAVGWLLDRGGRKRVLLAGAAIFALSPLLYIVARPLWAFQAVRLLNGLGIAAFTSAYTTLVADLAPPARRGEGIGLSGVTNNLGMLFAPALGAYVAAKHGYAVHFALASLLGAVCVLILLPVVEPEQVPSTGRSELTLWQVARRRVVWVAAFGTTGLAVAYGAVLSFLPPFTSERGLTAAGAYFSAFALAMMVGQASAGWLSDRIGRRAVAIPGMALVVSAMVGLALSGTNVGLVASGAVLGLSWGLARAGIDSAVVDAVPENVRGSAISVLYTVFDVGIGAGSFGLGVAAQAQGYVTAFTLAAIWAAIALAGYLAWSRRSYLPGSSGLPGR